MKSKTNTTIENGETQRLLTEEEIDFIVDFITPRKGIPPVAANGFVKINKDRLKRQFIGKTLFPSLIPKLKEEIETSWYKSQIPPGECVGIICALSIGEKNTQSALNTFHKAGQTVKAVTEGVPRLQELLNATKNPRSVSHKIFFTRHNETVNELRSFVNYSISGFTFKDLVKNFEIIHNKKNEYWYSVYNAIHYPKRIPYPFLTCIRYTLDLSKMYEYQIPEQLIVQKIQAAYEDVQCYVTPFPGEGKIDVFVDSEKVVLPNGLVFDNSISVIDMYLDDVVQPNLDNIHICGIKGINEIYFSKDEEKSNNYNADDDRSKLKSSKSKWFIETDASTVKGNNTNKLRSIMNMKNVDQYNTMSNEMWEIYEMFGIEATRQFLVEEFTLIMDGINECHARLLVDRMTHSGSISSISRYTLKSDESGPMGKASFEESLDNFMKAAIYGETENTNGVSASIICGKRSNIGTGMMGLRMDMNT